MVCVSSVPIPHSSQVYPSLDVMLGCDVPADICNAPFVVPRFQSLAEVPVWEVLQSGADRNHGALRGWEVHLNEHSGWIQVRVPKVPSI